uniref:40S ribosomal protein S7 n=1 Tax=Loa loa TaxID=7209 RepID=A0A1I7VIB9_LOALO
IQLPKFEALLLKEAEEPSVFVTIEENGRQIRRHTLNVTFVVVHKIAGRSKILLQATVAETLGRNIQLPQTLGN